MSTDVSKNQLKPITLPGYSRSDFGRALSEQFANINTNFQKIGSGELGKGDDGKSCIYIFYNLNSIFVYSTVESGAEFNSWYSFNKRIYGNDCTLSADHKDKYIRMRDEVRNDYEEYHRITGRTESEYVAACAYLLFGSTKVFVNDAEATAVPEDFSLTGALYADADPAAAEPVTMETTSGNLLTYRAIWLRDWFLAKAEDKLNIYSTHILNFDPGRISIACSPTTDEAWKDLGYYRPISSMSYLHVDPRFRNNLTGNQMVGIRTAEDTSGVCYWESEKLAGDPNPLTGRFKVAHLFPQIYYNGSGYYWKINGNNTNIPVTGAQGEPGHSSQLVVVERVENITGATPGMPQGDPELGGGPWVPDLGEQQVVVNAYAGSLQRNISLNGDRAADYAATYSKVPGVYTSTEGDPVATPQYRVEAWRGWLPGTREWNNMEVNHTFRVLGILGSTRFFETEKGKDYKTGAVAEGKGYRPDDPSYAQYNYGDEDALGVSDNDAIQKKIKELDGVPCIVLPGPAYRLDRTSTTVWFATLKRVPVVQDDTSDRYQLIVYCGPENQFTTSLDDHSFAGMMQELDAYSYKNSGDNRNRPRGLMIPIGSAHVYSNNKTDIWASHLIYADQAGFDSIAEGEDAGGRKYHYGNPKLKTVKPVLGKNTNLPQSDSLDFQGDQHQFIEAVEKRFLHIGSVNDYRALNDVPNIEATGKVFNAGIPGRKRDYEEKELMDANGQKYDVIGNSGHYGALTNGWFQGSELHVDEPVTITGYRDLEKKRYLLNVEGDVTIGRFHHVNDGNRGYKAGAGGLLIKSTLSSEVRTKLYNPNPKSEEVDTGLENDDTSWNYGVGQLMAGIKITYPNPFIQAGSDDKNSHFELVKIGGEDNPAFKDSGTIYQPNMTYPSLLAQDMIGARVLVATDGITIQESSGNSNFSVDVDGNIQTNGKEVRSNNEDTLWAFHTKWKYRDGTIGSLPIPSYTSLNDNELIFGTSHVYRYKDIWNETTTISDPDKIGGFITHIGYGGLSNGEIQWSKEVYNGKNNIKLPTITQSWSNLFLQRGGMMIAEPSDFLFGVPFGDSAPIIKDDISFIHWVDDKNFTTTTKSRFGLCTYGGLMIGSPANKGKDEGELRLRMKAHKWNDTTNDVDYNFFGQNGLEKKEYSIGLYVEGSAFIQSSLILGQDLRVGGSAGFDKQIRATSFRRRCSSNDLVKVDKEKYVSLLFDNGKSSVVSPAWKVENGTSKLIFPEFNNNTENAVGSPIVIDMGSEYDEAERLVKFGTCTYYGVSGAGSEKLENTGEDRKIFLLGKLPNQKPYKHIIRYPTNIPTTDENNNPIPEFDEWSWCPNLIQNSWNMDPNIKSSSYQDYIDRLNTPLAKKQSTKTNPFKVWAIADKFKVDVWIQILLNVKHASASHHANQKYRSTGYGIRLVNGRLKKNGNDSGAMPGYTQDGSDAVKTGSGSVDSVKTRFVKIPGYVICTCSEDKEDIFMSISNAGTLNEYSIPNGSITSGGQSIKIGDVYDLGQGFGDRIGVNNGGGNYDGCLITPINNGIAWMNPIQCTGFNWNTILPGVPPPLFNVDCSVPRVGMDGLYPRSWSYCGSGTTSPSQNITYGDGSDGAVFRLDTAGRLILVRSNGIGGLVQSKNQTITLHFSYMTGSSFPELQKKKYLVTNAAAFKSTSDNLIDPWNDISPRTRNELMNAGWTYWENPVDNPPVILSRQSTEPSDELLNSLVVNGVAGGWNFLWEEDGGNISLVKVRCDARYPMDYNHWDEYSKTMTCSVGYCLNHEFGEDIYLGMQPTDMGSKTEWSVTPISWNELDVDDRKKLQETLNDKYGDLAGWNEVDNWVDFMENDANGAPLYTWKSWVIRRILAYSCQLCFPVVELSKDVSKKRAQVSTVVADFYRKIYGGSPKIALWLSFAAPLSDIPHEFSTIYWGTVEFSDHSKIYGRSFLAGGDSTSMVDTGFGVAGGGSQDHWWGDLTLPEWNGTGGGVNPGTSFPPLWDGIS